MKLQHKISALLAAALLVSGTAWADYPWRGVYEKTVDGKLQARMHVILGEGNGEPDGKDIGTLAAPFIYIQSFDASGKQVGQYATAWIGKTADIGAGELAVTINEANVDKILNLEQFQVETHRDKGSFWFKDMNNAVVYNCGDLMNGDYVRALEKEPVCGPALITFAYTKTYDRGRFEEGRLSSGYYTYKENPQLGPQFVDFVVRSSPDGYDEADLLLDKGFHFVMKSNYIEFIYHKNIFTTKDYPSWAQENMQAFRGQVNTKANPAYLLQEIYRTYPYWTDKNQLVLNHVDFYGGEGANAVYTDRYRMQVNDDIDGYRIVGQAEHSSDGSTRVKYYTCNGTITGDEVRVRTQPNLQCDVITYYNKGQVIQSEGYVHGTHDEPVFKWVRIKLPDGRRGYVHGNFVKLVNS